MKTKITNKTINEAFNLFSYQGVPATDEEKRFNVMLLENLPVIGGYSLARVPCEQIRNFIGAMGYTRKRNDVVVRICEAFDPKKMEAIVCYYDEELGRFFVVKGMQRCVAAYLMGETAVPALICDHILTPSDAAKMFAEIDETAEPLTELERHRAAVVYKDTIAVEIETLKEEYGFDVHKGAGTEKPWFRTLHGIMEALKSPMLGVEGTRAVLDCYRAAGWLDEPVGLNTCNFIAVSHMFRECVRRGVPFEKAIKKFGKVFFEISLEDACREAKEYRVGLHTETSSRYYYIDRVLGRAGK